MMDVSFHIVIAYVFFHFFRDGFFSILIQKYTTTVSHKTENKIPISKKAKNTFILFHSFFYPCPINVLYIRFNIGRPIFSIIRQVCVLKHV
jgi:hypothetical protein